MQSKYQYGGKLLAQGSYGCVYNPSYTCNGIKTDDKNIVSKIQVNDSVSKREIEISKLIKTIPSYKTYFSPVLSSCIVSMNKFENGELSKCEALNDIKTNEKLLLTQMHKINGETLYYNIYNTMKNFSQSNIKILMDNYPLILNCIEKLLTVNIVHLDLHESNILVKDDNKMPILIDYGFSIIINELRKSIFNVSKIDSNNGINFKILHKYLPSYNPKVYYFTPELHLLCYISSNRLVSPPTNIELSKIASDIVESNEILNDHFSNEFKDQYIEQILKSFKNLLKSENTNTISECIHKCIKGYKTWDNFALSMIYISLIQQLISKDYINLIKPVYNMEFIKKFMRLLLTNISPIIEKRYSVNESIKYFEYEL